METPYLTPLLEQNRPIWIMGAYDVLSAKSAEPAGKTRRSLSLPIVVDFEQGFGEPYASVFWMHEFERAGVAAVHIDDYGLPYKCPFIPPHVMALESMDETPAKIRGMVGEKLDRRFMVIGRPGTYVARVHLDEESRREDWIRRARA